MSDIEQKVAALLRECAGPQNALRLSVKQHEATKQEYSDFRQKVHDAVWAYFRPYEVPSVFRHIISWEPIPAPKPDPLVEVLGDLEWNNNSPECAVELRAALDARGLKIVEVKNDE